VPRRLCRDFLIYIFHFSLFKKKNNNNCFEHPLIIGGWNRLQNIYNFRNNSEVLFGYYGYNCFGIISWRDIDFSCNILAYHSRSIYPKETWWFDIALTEETAKKRKLVE
jgi:hypothetical protein